MTDYLLDTHTLLWVDTDPKRLPPETLRLIRNYSTAVFVSSITAWELGIKHSLGKLSAAEGLVASFSHSLSLYGFREISFSSSDALRAAQLPPLHKDPFDRALASQALERDLVVLSLDLAFDTLGAARAW